MSPQLATALDWLTEANTQELGIRERRLVQLGLPDDGAMVIARAPKKQPQRLVLASSTEASRETRAPSPHRHDEAKP